MQDSSHRECSLVLLACSEVMKHGRGREAEAYIQVVTIAARIRLSRPQPSTDGSWTEQTIPLLQSHHHPISIRALGAKCSVGVFYFVAKELGLMLQAFKSGSCYVVHHRPGEATLDHHFNADYQIPGAEFSNYGSYANL